MSSQYDRLFNSLLWLTTKKTSKVTVTGLLWRESTSDRWISTQRPVYYGKFSMPWRHQEAMKIHTCKWLILRETSCRTDINKLLAIEYIIINIMSVFNTTGIPFPDIKWLIPWSLFVFYSVMLCALPKWWRTCNRFIPDTTMLLVLLTDPTWTHCGRNNMAAILKTFWTSFS